MVLNYGFITVLVAKNRVREYLFQTKDKNKRMVLSMTKNRNPA